LITGELPGGVIRIQAYSEKCFGVQGDRDGLVSLAMALLTVAHRWDHAPADEHIHMDAGMLLDDDSVSLVVQRLTDG